MHRSRWWSVVVAFLLLGSLGSAFVLTDGAAAQQTTQSDDWGTNALVIKYVGEPNSDSSYTVDFDGEVHSIDTEPEDSVYKNSSGMGEVSPSDRTDTIRYSGDIKRIKSSGERDTIRFYVDGKEINENNYHPGLTQTSSESPTTTGTTHTLVIEPKGDKRGEYNAAFSSEPTLKQTEDSDSRTGTSVNGNVGGLPWQDNSTDEKDVIQFRGQVLDFETSGNITVKLDGKRVDPASLSQTPQPTASPPSQGVPTSSPTPPAETSPSTIQSPQAATDSDGFPLIEVLAGVVAGMAIVVIGGVVLQKW